MCILDLDYPTSDALKAYHASRCGCADCLYFLSVLDLAEARPAVVRPQRTIPAQTGELRYIRNKIAELQQRIATLPAPAQWHGSPIAPIPPHRAQQDAIPLDPDKLIRLD